MSLNIGQTSNFSPNQISGCHIWLDASTSNNFTFSSGSNISTWIDRSSNSYTATAANSPRYDSVNKRVWFSGASSQYMSNLAAPLNLAQRSFFFVIQEITNANVCGIMPIIPSPTSGLDYTTTNGMTIEGTTGVLFFANNGAYNNKAVASVPLAKGLYGETFASSSGIAYVNGTPGTSSNSSFTFGTSAGYGLGGRWGGTTMQSPFFNGYFHEVVVFNNALSSNNRQIMEGYLAWKWGINRSLPTTHPYYNTPVYSLNMPNVIFPLYNSPTPTFQPTFFSNCTLWLDAADRSTVSAAGTSVTQWRDKSGSGNHASVVGTIRYTAVIGGLPAMNYPGTAPNYLTGTLINNGTTMTSFAVFQMNSASYTSARVLSLAKTATSDFNNTLYTAAISRSGSSFLSYRASSPRGSIAATFGTAVQNATVFTGASNTYYQNGTAGTTVASSGSFGYSNYEVGGSFGEESLVPYSGCVCEVIHYTSALDTTQRQQVEGYLAWKWGIQGSLDSAHPYKSYGFTTFPPFPAINAPNYGSSGKFTPSSLGNLSLWFDTADSTTLGLSGTNVTSWTSKGTNTVVVSQSANNPLYVRNFYRSFPSIRFSFGSTLPLSNASVSSSAVQTSLNYTIFLVHTPNANNSTPFAFLTGGGSRLSVVTPEGSNIPFDGISSRLSYMYPSQAAYLNGALRQESFYSVNSTGFYRRDGAQLATGSLGSGTYNATQNFFIGGAVPNYGGYYYGGDICEVVWYNLALNTDQITQVEGYLAWKWGLVGNLPSTHPYKLFPPPS
jgi:hypothetical protein